MDKGVQIKPSDWAKLMKERVEQPDCVKNGWLMEAFPKTRFQAFALRKIGVFPTHIGSETVFLETGSAGRRSGQGRRWATTPNEDRYLVLTARRDRNMNATLFQQHLRSATGTTVSTQSVRNRLHGVGLYAHRPMVCVRLTSRHRRDRRNGNRACELEEK
ncbi:transposable element Tcb2 transposase [Trichonephila clavipes]|nr:transposable element Tcb2 transposase [Trichonephila clavipes]